MNTNSLSRVTVVALRTTVFTVRTTHRLHTVTLHLHTPNNPNYCQKHLETHIYSNSMSV